ncbi:protein yippee-like 1 [Eurytemora carolleeae]|uniref:protein yippee-like 1 n=1 Tax=Eurytemora carolleeae TaxID=1294199 RepID=UPI000C78C633|nr:protein yippee-like 1 [Eurytemora carolleeae]|eukprot:XP_023329286.1 protein yippee-like 1 [Eurytemora affinis]
MYRIQITLKYCHIVVFHFPSFLVHTGLYFFRTYSCVHCRAHLANHDELISKSFQGSQGRAYLFNSVVNVGCGPAEERVLLTGLHAVADIYCDCCKTTLGWKYEHAFESSQKYKEGKFIIELAHMIKENGWEKTTSGT